MAGRKADLHGPERAKKEESTGEEKNGAMYGKGKKKDTERERGLNENRQKKKIANPCIEGKPETHFSSGGEKVGKSSCPRDSQLQSGLSTRGRVGGT